MSNDKNIENFDSFFKDAFNSFEPTAPKGVFEALQSQIGIAGSGTATTGAVTAAKAGAWGLSKIIIGAVAAIAVATAVYIAIPTKNTATINEDKNTIDPTENSTQHLTHPTTPSTENTATNNTTTTKEIANNTATNSANTAQPISKNTGGVQTENTQINTSQNGKPDAGDNGGIENTTPPLPQKENHKIDGNDAPKGNIIMVGIYLSDKQLCVNDRLTVTIADNLSKNRYKVNFGDGSSVTTKIGKPTTHKYANGGKFKVIAKEISGKKETIEQWVEVRKIEAAFTVEKSDNATYRFVNKSKNAAHYTWFFGDNSTATRETSPIHTFKNFSLKTYKVKLIAMDNVGCIDSFSTYVKQSYTYEDKKPKMYNVFSPGIDGRNDYYKIEIEEEEKYHLIVLDKKGNKVFESNDKNTMWNGQNMYTGDNCPAANYIVVFSYKIKGFEERQEKKFLTLVR